MISATVATCALVVIIVIIVAVCVVSSTYFYRCILVGTWGRGIGFLPHWKVVTWVTKSLVFLCSCGLDAMRPSWGPGLVKLSWSDLASWNNGIICRQSSVDISPWNSHSDNW